MSKRIEKICTLAELYIYEMLAKKELSNVLHEIRGEDDDYEDGMVVELLKCIGEVSDVSDWTFKYMMDTIDNIELTDSELEEVQIKAVRLKWKYGELES